MDIMKALDWRLNTITCSEMVFLMLVKFFTDKSPQTMGTAEKRARDLLDRFHICILSALSNSGTQEANYMEMAIAVIISIFEICGLSAEAKKFSGWTLQNYRFDHLKVNLVWDIIFGFAIRSLFHPDDQSPYKLSLFQKEGKGILALFEGSDDETPGPSLAWEGQEKDELEMNENVSTNYVTPIKNSANKNGSKSILRKKRLNKKLIAFKQPTLTTTKKSEHEGPGSETSLHFQSPKSEFD